MQRRRLLRRIPGRRRCARAPAAHAAALLLPEHLRLNALCLQRHGFPAKNGGKRRQRRAQPATPPRLPVSSGARQLVPSMWRKLHTLQERRHLDALGAHGVAPDRAVHRRSRSGGGGGGGGRWRFCVIQHLKRRLHTLTVKMLVCRPALRRQRRERRQHALLHGSAFAVERLRPRTRRTRTHPEVAQARQHPLPRDQVIHQRADALGQPPPGKTEHQRQRTRQRRQLQQRGAGVAQPLHREPSTHMPKHAAGIAGQHAVPAVQARPFQATTGQQQQRQSEPERPPRTSPAVITLTRHAAAHP